MMTRRTLLSVTPTLLLAETAEQRGKRVIDEAITALGGDHFLAMRNRVESGRAYSFFREQLRGLSIAKIYTEYLSKSDAGSEKLAYRERQNFGPKEDSGVLFNEEDGWELTFRGARPLPEVQVARHKEAGLHNIFYILRERLKEPGMTFDGQGFAILDNQPVENVEIVDSNNSSVLVAFHRSTKLPVKQTYYRRDPQSRERIPETTLFNKYRNVGGVQWPFNVLRERDGEKIFELFSENVLINQQLAPKLFQLSKGTPILKREKE